MKQALIALVLIAVGSWLAHLHVASQTYHPVVRLASPDGLTYTTVQDEVQERRACGAANDRFLKPIKEMCKTCQVVFARCERKLEGLEEALAHGAAVPHPDVPPVQTVGAIQRAHDGGLARPGRPGQRHALASPHLHV